MDSGSRPIVPFRRGFPAFRPLHDLRDHFGPSLPLKIVDRISTSAFLHDAWPDRRMERFDAHDQFADSVRRAMKLALRGRMPSSNDMAGGRRTWRGADGSVPSQQTAFSRGPA